MRAFLRRLRLAEYGGDELLLATLACAASAWALGAGIAPHAMLAALPPWLGVLWFFRDPNRATPAAPGLLTAPADGTVTDIAEVDEPSFIGGRAVRVGIFLSPLNVHVNRSPCDGVVSYLDYRAGEFLPAYNEKAPERNESQALGLYTGEGRKVMVKQISGVVARRIVCEAQLGKALARGERYGMIKFGSRTELYVPASSAWRVEAVPGQKVRGGKSVLMRQAPEAERERETGG